PPRIQRFSVRPRCSCQGWPATTCHWVRTAQVPTSRSSSRCAGLAAVSASSLARRGTATTGAPKSRSSAPTASPSRRPGGGPYSRCVRCARGGLGWSDGRRPALLVLEDLLEELLEARRLGVAEHLVGRSLLAHDAL